MKRVATGEVSKKYQTILFAQLSKTLLENVNFDLNIQKPPSKITRYVVHLPTENVSSYFMGWNGVYIQQQLNPSSSRLSFEKTSVDSCQKSSSN